MIQSGDCSRCNRRFVLQRQFGYDAVGKTSKFQQKLSNFIYKNVDLLSNFIFTAQQLISDKISVYFTKLLYTGQNYCILYKIMVY